jgi:hypothetical protein
MHLGGGCNERVHCVNGSAEGVVPGHQATPFIKTFAFEPQEVICADVWKSVDGWICRLRRRERLGTDHRSA